MDYEDYLIKCDVCESQSEYEDNLIALQVLLEYLEKNSEHEFLYQNTGNFMDDLLKECFLGKGTDREKLLMKILEKYNFNYSMSIHNAIYYLLGKEIELLGSNINPLLWPGVKNIRRLNSRYVLDTELGNIEVYKASELFSNTSSAYVFCKPLMQQCYERTYDFVKQNKDYNAVLSYMPNFFCEGHYHAYLEKDSQILDIAANAYYDSSEYASKVLQGNIIKKLSFEEIEEEFDKIQRKVPQLSRYSKLHVLSLHYDKRDTLT